MPVLSVEEFGVINRRRSQEDGKNLFEALAANGYVVVEGSGVEIVLPEADENEDVPSEVDAP